MTAEIGPLTTALYQGFKWAGKNENKRVETQEVNPKYQRADLDKNGEIETREAWDYFFTHVNELPEILQILEDEVQFEYPFKTDNKMSKYVEKLTTNIKSEEKKARIIYDAILEELKVRPNQDPSRRQHGDQTALEVFHGQDRKRFALCNEYTFLFMSLARLAGLKTNYVEVKRELGGYHRSHACAEVIINDKSILVDPAYPKYNIKYPKRRILTDREATAVHYSNEGWIFMENGKLQEAEEAYSKAIGLDPQCAKAYNNLGDLYFKQGKFKDAEKYWIGATKIDGQYANACYNLGILYYNQDKIEKAKEFWLKAIKIEPKFVEAYNYLGASYYGQGRLEDAKRYWIKATRIDPNFTEARHNLGILYKSIGQTEK